jgi:hypothetical protein
MSQRKLENEPSKWLSTSTTLTARMIIFWLFKNSIEKYQQKTTWDDVGAHSAIPAEHVQSQVARATANNLNICQDEYRRRSNKNCKQTGLQYFPAIPGRFHWLPSSTICLILLFVTSSTLRQVQKTKSSYSVGYTVALLATVGFRTWVILPTQLTPTCLPAKQKHVQWERYQGTICTFRSTIYGTFLFKKHKIADASFRTGKKLVSEEPFPH